MISLIVIVMSKIGYSKPGSSDYIVIFRSNQKEPWNTVDSSVQSLIKWKHLRGATELDNGKEFEYTYSLRFAAKASPEKLIGEITNGSIRQVTLIAPENHLEL